MCPQLTSTEEETRFLITLLIIFIVQQITLYSHPVALFSKFASKAFIAFLILSNVITLLTAYAFFPLKKKKNDRRIAKKC